MGLQLMAVLPNPFEHDLQLMIQSDKSQVLSIQLVDMTGREVYRVMKSVNVGNNPVMLSSFSHLSKGLYVLKVMEGKEVVITTRVNKAR